MLQLLKYNAPKRHKVLAVPKLMGSCVNSNPTNTQAETSEGRFTPVTLFADINH